MSNKSVSDFVATAMDAALKSQEYKTLFGTQYKFASDENDAKKHKHECGECGKDMDSCTCDSAMADDNDAKKGKMPPWLKDKKKDSSDESSAWDSDDANKDSSDSSHADDEDNASDDIKSSAAFDVAIDSLLTASAALDAVGMEKSATFSLKLASLVVEAKKKEKESKKSKKDSKDSKDSKKSSKSDSQSAKDKKSDKKSDKKDSKSTSSSSSSSSKSSPKKK